jgi:hypothetical protein
VLIVPSLQGRLPEGLKLVEDEELREFIELCISHAPNARPDTRRLLKHSFFEDIRKNAEKEREAEKIAEAGADALRDLSPTGMPPRCGLLYASGCWGPESALGAVRSAVKHATHAGSLVSRSIASASDGSVSSEHAASPGSPAPLAGWGSAQARAHALEEAAAQRMRSAPGAVALAPEGPARHNSHGMHLHPNPSAPASVLQTAVSDGSGSNNGAIDRVFVRAEPSQLLVIDGEGGTTQVMSMEVGNLPQAGGETCNIEFSFEVGVDKVEDIIHEMKAELNLALAEEDAVTIQRKIEDGLRKCVARVLP